MIKKASPLVEVILLTVSLASMVLSLSPVRAELDLHQVLQTTPQTRLEFAPHTVGSVIMGGGDRVYHLNIKQGQYLNIQINSMGARAMLMVFDPTGKQLVVLNGQSQPFDYKIPTSGDYALFFYSGPTVHTYDVTVRVE